MTITQTVTNRRKSNMKSPPPVVSVPLGSEFMMVWSSGWRPPLAVGGGEWRKSTMNSQTATKGGTFVLCQICKCKFHAARTFEVTLDKKEGSRCYPGGLIGGFPFLGLALPSFPTCLPFVSGCCGRSSLGREMVFLR